MAFELKLYMYLVVTYDGMEYKIEMAPLNWLDAERGCQKGGADIEGRKQFLDRIVRFKVKLKHGQG